MFFVLSLVTNFRKLVVLLGEKIENNENSIFFFDVGQSYIHMGVKL